LTTPVAAWGVTDAFRMLERVGPAERAFPVASVTKLLVAVASWVALEEGTIGLDDAAGPPGSTVRHLLAHTSGLAFTGDRVVVPPGTRRVYSNTGFDVVGRHLAARAALPVATYLDEAVSAPLGLRSTRLIGSPAAGALSSVDDLLAVGRELLAPRLVSRATLGLATSVAFPGLDGVVPGFGRQHPNDWGLGVEIKSAKRPHWTAPDGSPRTFGHFGRSGSFLWVDPDAGLSCAYLGDRDFGPWAADEWPALSSTVLARHRTRPSQA
jgi:CubicO group peptidase (beta-lactamase class C family)